MRLHISQKELAVEEITSQTAKISPVGVQNSLTHE